MPSNTLKHVVGRLIDEGEAIYTYVGVRYTLVTGEGPAERDLSVFDGAVVIEVMSGGPAGSAGSEAGDVVPAIGGGGIDARSSYQTAHPAARLPKLAPVCFVAPGGRVTCPSMEVKEGQAP